MSSSTSRPGHRERVRLYRSEAVVLRRRDLGEADRILTLYTPHRGKLRVVAKGVRKTKSRLAGHLEPFARTSLLLAQGRNLDIVTQAQLVEPFQALRSDEARIAHAGYLADLLDALTVEGQENEAAWDALVQALALLNQPLDPYVTARHFELRLLTVLGFRPELGRCVLCDRPLEPVPNTFSPSAGGVLCQACGGSDPQALSLSVNALKFLRLLERGEIEVAYRLRLTTGLRLEVEDVLRSHVRHLIERDLPSYAVLKALTHDQPPGH